MMDLYGNGLLLGEKTLDSLWMRQNLTMNNIANVDTPGFKSKLLVNLDYLFRSSYMSV